ncbi:zinc finger protein zat9 [Phtheirospermum japonicum]|uniref:Zinc finger protein zat9 n=1 Tax=Phtheirospermum japonicum TaxID=374723 RepID=A0A830B1G1_9LAMI|nr:zinc finger protein zat9 [Phtheirospermum japonicum]
MEKRHRCKLCFRNFANGRALGGHMRSHMMKFYDEAKKKQQYDDDDDDFQSIHSFSSMSSSSSSSSSSEEESEEVKAVLVDHGDFYVAAALQDRGSETESSMKTRKKIIKRSRRSKRVSKSRISDFDGFFQVKKKSKLEEEEEEERKNSYDQSSLSSISDTTPEEHVAHCLIMLSRDKWRRAEVEFHGEEEEDDAGGGKERKFGGSGVRKVIKTKVRGKYRCEECNKLFKSYQALGGHRASHKKVRAEAAAPPNSGGGPKAAKLHECPFCQRVFSSGQALGGHKRSHFIGPGAISGNVGNTGAVVQNSRNGEILNIDLNLPAPMDDEENSQIAVSAVSDAEFVHPIKL